MAIINVGCAMRTINRFDAGTHPARDKVKVDEDI